MNHIALKFKSTLIFCFFYLITAAQTPDQNLDKYWDYKERLTTKFLVEENQLTIDPFHIEGINIPAHSRNPTGNFTDHTIKWADAGHHIGYYLATLATEYKLLKMHSLDVSKTITGIKYLLHTIERLDYTAESNYGSDLDCPFLWNPGGAWELRYPYADTDGKCLNGFFIRDDVPMGTNGFSDYWENNGYPQFSNVLKETSDYPYPSLNEMSQDQVWNLLEGLALVKKLVDHTATFTDGDGVQVTIKNWAQKISYRIIRIMQGYEQTDIWVPCGFFSGCWPGHWVEVESGAWLIRNPETGDIVYRGGGVDDLTLNSYLFAEAGNWITEEQWGDLHYNSINEPHNIYPLPITKHYNNHAKIALSCIGKLDWSESFESLTYWLYKIAHGPDAASGQDGYNTHLGGDYSRFTFVHFPLMYIVLHDINISDDNYYFYYYMSYIERLLDMAAVDGPSVGLYDINNDGTIGDNDYSSEFWGTAGKRLVKPVGMDLPDNYQSKHWEYNGIDYMLLYNLYLLGLYSQNSNSLNITENFPTRYNGWEDNGLTSGVDEDDITIGKQADETALHISSLSDIEANNTIKSNAKVVYSSSGNVVLAPGFEVETGGEFPVEINEYNYQKN